VRDADADGNALRSESELQSPADTVEHLELAPRGAGIDRHRAGPHPPQNALHELRVVRRRVEDVSTPEDRRREPGERPIDVPAPGENELRRLEVGALHEPYDRGLRKCENVLRSPAQVRLEADTDPLRTGAEGTEDLERSVDVHG